MKIANWVIVSRYGFFGAAKCPTFANWQNSPGFAFCFETEEEAESVALMIAARNPDLIGTIKVIKREFAA